MDITTNDSRREEIPNIQIKKLKKYDFITSTLAISNINYSEASNLGTLAHNYTIRRN